MSSFATPVDGAFRKVTARETVILLTLAWLVPFLVHLVPWAGARPLGAYLLPMFWATFAAVYLYGAGTGLLVGLFAPAVNLLVTGLPAWRSFGSTALELVVFVLVEHHLFVLELVLIVLEHHHPFLVVRHQMNLHY